MYILKLDFGPSSKQDTQNKREIKIYLISPTSLIELKLLAPIFTARREKE